MTLSAGTYVYPVAVKLEMLNGTLLPWPDNRVTSTVHSPLASVVQEALRNRRVLQAP